MNDFTDNMMEVTEDLAVVTLADGKPAIKNPQEEAARMPECEHCGHRPCGCGG